MQRVLGFLEKYQSVQFSSVQFSRSVMSASLWPHELQHARPPCPSPTTGVYSNSCPSSRWCYPAISSSVVPFSSCPQSLPASGSFPLSQLFTWGGQSIGVSALASVLPMNTQDWSPSEWTDCYKIVCSYAPLYIYMPYDATLQFISPRAEVCFSPSLVWLGLVFCFAYYWVG